ncbi:MAG: hypothetical protein HYR55_17435 [Acidobacteria bacterium]|nr:hypothetical protein [Acidobacteriota bacterium]MBI3657072.1 hypothetical protein [Acidobacteriota bacterium]
MNHDQEEKELKELFQQQRWEDERAAPRFAKVWAAAVSRHKRRQRPRRLLPIAAAALIVLTISGAVAIFFKPSANRLDPPALSSAAASITTWQSPTDFLLHSPGEPLLITVPRLGESLLEIPGHDSRGIYANSAQ